MLVIDPMAKSEELVALVVSVVYRGGPACGLVPRTGGQPGSWMPDMTVRVLCDRDLWSPRLWATIRR